MSTVEVDPVEERDEELVEAWFDELLHPRNRLGRWRDTFRTPQPQRKPEKLAGKVGVALANSIKPMDKSESASEAKARDLAAGRPYRVSEIRANAIGDLLERVKKLNARAAKLGVEPMVVSPVSDTRFRVDEDNNATGLLVMDVAIIGQPPKLKGERFIAKIEPSGDGVLTSRPPYHTEEDGKIDLEPFKKHPTHCEHCGLDRQRAATYVLKNEHTEKLTQVGSNCLKDFTGHPDPLKVSHLYEEYGAIDDDLGIDGGGGDRAPRLLMAERLMAAAVAASRTHGFVSKKQADEAQGERVATAEVVYDMLMSRRPSPMAQEVSVGDDDREKAAVILAWVKDQQPTSEYISNLKVVLGSEAVEPRRMNLAVSAVGAYLREMEWAAKRQADEAAAAQKGPAAFLGQEGEKVGRPAVLQTQRDIDGHYGTTTLYSFLSDDGYAMKWFSSRNLGLTDGERYQVNGTVKKHEEFRGQKQTAITRAKVTPLAVGDKGKSIGGTTLAPDQEGELKANETVVFDDGGRDQRGVFLGLGEDAEGKFARVLIQDRYSGLRERKVGLTENWKLRRAPGLVPGQHVKLPNGDEAVIRHQHGQKYTVEPVGRNVFEPELIGGFAARSLQPWEGELTPMPSKEEREAVMASAFQIGEVVLFGSGESEGRVRIVSYRGNGTWEVQSVDPDDPETILGRSRFVHMTAKTGNPASGLRPVSNQPWPSLTEALVGAFDRLHPHDRLGRWATTFSNTTAPYRPGDLERYGAELGRSAVASMLEKGLPQISLSPPGAPGSHTVDRVTYYDEEAHARGVASSMPRSRVERRPGGWVVVKAGGLLHDATLFKPFVGDAWADADLGEALLEGLMRAAGMQFEAVHPRNRLGQWTEVLAALSKVHARSSATKLAAAERTVSGAQAVRQMMEQGVKPKPLGQALSKRHTGFIDVSTGRHYSATRAGEFAQDLSVIPTVNVKSAHAKSGTAAQAWHMETSGPDVGSALQTAIHPVTGEKGFWVSGGRRKRKRKDWFRKLDWDHPLVLMTEHPHARVPRTKGLYFSEAELQEAYESDLREAGDMTGDTLLQEDFRVGQPRDRAGRWRDVLGELGGVGQARIGGASHAGLAKPSKLPSVQVGNATGHEVLPGVALVGGGDRWDVVHTHTGLPIGKGALKGSKLAAAEMTRGAIGHMDWDHPTTAHFHGSEDHRRAKLILDHAIDRTQAKSNYGYREHPDYEADKAGFEDLRRRGRKLAEAASEPVEQYERFEATQARLLLEGRSEPVARRIALDAAQLRIGPEVEMVLSRGQREFDRQLSKAVLREAKDSLVKASTPKPFSTSKTSNWVARGGGLPSYIQHVAHALVKRGKSESAAIGMAIGIVRRWARGGGKVDSNTRAAAAKAIAEWEALKARNKAKSAAK